MRVRKLGVYGIVIALAACSIVASPARAGARHAKAKPSSKSAKLDAKRKLLDGTSPAAPDANGTPKASMPYAKTDTVRAFTNALGDTVYQVSASQADVSAPLSEMAAQRRQIFEQGEEQFETPENPILPAFRRITSSVPDPVVQPPL